MEERLEVFADAVGKALVHAIFGQSLEAWTGFWIRAWSSISMAAAILLGGYALSYMVLVFDDRQTARLIRLPVLLWAIATLLRGCNKGG